MSFRSQLATTNSGPKRLKLLPTYTLSATLSGGYILGYEAILQSDNARDLSLRDICGTDALNYLFEGATRVFYEDTLCVDPQCRRQHIAQKLSLVLIDALRDEGFTYLIGRTSIAAEAMRT